MKVIAVTLVTLILATITTEAYIEVQLACVDQEIGIRWPSYYNNADYYVCQGEGGKQLKMSCPGGEVFSFVLQVCSSPSKYIPPPPRDQLPTAAPSISKPMPWNPVQVEEPYRPTVDLPKPLMPQPGLPHLPQPGSPHLPTMPHLPHLPNGPQPPTVDLPVNYYPTDINHPPFGVTDGQAPNQPNKPLLPFPPTLEGSGIPQPPSPPPLAVLTQPPSIVKPPGGMKPPMPPSGGSVAQKPVVKPVVPLPPTPAPTPPLVKMTTTKPAAVKPVKPFPPSPPKKVMPKVPVKGKQN